MPVPEGLRPTEKLTRQQYEARFRRQHGLDFTIPPRFKEFSNLPDTVSVNTLTGLPIEDEHVANHLAGRLSEAIRTGKKWALVTTDVDNLKYVNDVMGDRQLGDVTIRYGIAKATQATEQALTTDNELREGVEVIALRGRDAADETTILALGINETEIAQLKNTVDQASRPTLVENPNFTFSISTGFISSDDPRIEPR